MAAAQADFLAGQVALVTGSGRGIGRAIALDLAQAGARLVVTARTSGDATTPGTIEHVAAEITAAGGEALPVAADVTDHDQVQHLLGRVLAHWGRIDILVLNAGSIGRNAHVLELTLDEWDAILTTNLRGAYLCAAAVAPVMVRQQSGVILGISSGAAERPGFLSVPYGVSKAGLERLIIGLAEDLRSDGIAALAYRAGFIDTPGTRAIYEPAVLASARAPADAARAVRFLLRDPAGFSGRIMTNHDLVALGAFETP